MQTYNYSSTPSASDRSAKSPVVRAIAWGLVAVQAVFLGVALAGGVPVMTSVVHQIGGGILIAALLANAAAFRPAKGAETVDGPSAFNQRERMVHTLFALMFFILLVMQTGGPTAP